MESPLSIFFFILSIVLFAVDFLTLFFSPFLSLVLHTQETSHATATATIQHTRSSISPLAPQVLCRAVGCILGPGWKTRGQGDKVPTLSPQAVLSSWDLGVFVKKRKRKKPGPWSTQPCLHPHTTRLYSHGMHPQKETNEPRNNTPYENTRTRPEKWGIPGDRLSYCF